jgi:hypothetical protein
MDGLRIDSVKIDALQTQTPTAPAQAAS